MGVKRSILGISGYYHDSAACLIQEGQIIAAAQEERFSRIKHDPRFPKRSVHYCLSKGQVALGEVDAIVYYDKPLLTFDRLLETYLFFAPRGFRSFAASMPAWLKQKLFLRSEITRELKEAFSTKERIPQILFSEHHQSHAASAFFPSPFDEAAVLCMDGVGEWATTSGWHGKGNQLHPLWQIRFPHSLGLFYSAFTYFAGFKVNSGEYKLMGLAPYGRPIFVQEIFNNLLDLKQDGSFRLNLDFFDYCTGLQMTNDHFASLFGGPPRKPESPITQREMDLARSIQVVTEEIVLRLGHAIHRDTKSKYLCMAGGVALNCVANGRLLREGPFEDIWIQPAAGDAGGALGCALVAWHQYYGMDRVRPLTSGTDSMSGGYLGPEYSNDEVVRFLSHKGIPYQTYDDTHLLGVVSKQIANEKVVGWFQGRMEFGPRALGARSILGDPRSSRMQSTMNLKIKYRESFRPFAPSVLYERAAQYFDLNHESPYMLLVAPLRENRRIPLTIEQSQLWGIDLLNVPRSDIPAVTHVDWSARIQTVRQETHPLYYGLIKEFEKLTGCPVLVNTSFNVRGEPIVCSPQDAYRCFMRTQMDVLVLGNHVLYKEKQPPWSEAVQDWQSEFTLD